MDKKKFIKLVSIAGFVVILDQITKALILKSLTLYQSIAVISGFFSITHVQNPGGAFGFFARQSPEVRSLVFIFFSLLAIICILYFYIRTPNTHPLLSGAFALILGGAVGNMIDRFRFGQVVDFLDFYIGNLHWPAFNVADSAISVGMAILVIHLLFNKMPD